MAIGRFFIYTLITIPYHLSCSHYPLANANAAASTEDLLDQYVKHVELSAYNLDSSAISPPPESKEDSPRHQHHRLGRSLKSTDDSLLIKRRDLSSSSDDIQWSHSEVLDGGVGRIVLRWQTRHQEIIFRVEARTHGYIGIGFSPDGSMQKADMVIGWFDDRLNRPILLDCHGVDKSQGSAPVRDEIDNYTLMRGFQNNTHTVLEFRRVLDTCDPDDYVLSSDTVRVIWALQDIDPPRGAEMVYHGNNRGSQSLHLMAPSAPPKVPVGPSKQWDVVFENLEVSANVDTMYWCKVFKPPTTIIEKQHIIGFEPIISSNHTSMVHQMMMYECELTSEDDIMQWESFANEKGRFCYSNMPMQWEKCLTPLIAWGVGSKGETFPSHVGLPLAGKKNSFYMLEVHFDNPSMKKAVGTSGLRLHYTSEWRKNEGGILITGIAPSMLHFIPPHQKEYKTAGYCSLDCTKEVIPKTGINVVSVMLHSHLAARKLKLRHLRHDKELPPLAEDNHYDFNYQQSRYLSQDISILPGDGLITECTYSTLDRNTPTLGGYSTKEEMCLAFVLHYPRTKLSGCYSTPPVKYFFEALGIKKFYGRDMNNIEQVLLEGKVETATLPSETIKPFETLQSGDEMSQEVNRQAILALQRAKEYTIDDGGGESSNNHHDILSSLVIEEPPEFKNLSFMEHLQQMPYNESIFTSKVEEYFYKGLHLTFCRKKDDTMAIKETIEPLPTFQQYKIAPSFQCSHKSKSTFSYQEPATMVNSSNSPFVYLQFIIFIQLQTLITLL